MLVQHIFSITYRRLRPQYDLLSDALADMLIAIFTVILIMILKVIQVMTLIIILVVILIVILIIPLQIYGIHFKIECVSALLYRRKRKIEEKENSIKEMIRYMGKFCVIILAALPLYLLLRRPWKNRSKPAGEWALGIFILFTVSLSALALEGEYGSPAQMLQAAAARIATGQGINLRPFHTIGYFFLHFSFDVFMINIVGNIVMFVPWGFGLMLLWKRNRHFHAVVLYSLALPLSIETCQLFIGRNVDIDDLILNFLGGCLGSAIYFGLVRHFPGYFQGMQIE